MKRTYIKPQSATVATDNQPFCAARSWAAGTIDKNNKLNVEDPLTDMGKVITDKDLKENEYNPWTPSNW